MIGLPSLRDLDGASGARIWLAAEPTDMRCGFDRLAEQVRSVISPSVSSAEKAKPYPSWIGIGTGVAPVYSIMER